MAVPDFEPRGVEYLYVQMADHIAARIEAGELPSGAKLPGEQELAREYRLGLQTARNALDALRKRGLVVTKPSKGTFVA